jgi:hypothetical protein
MDMRIESLALVAGLTFGLAACGLHPVIPDAARVAQGTFGGMDDDMAAANQAQWAFADTSRTYGRPVEAARAAASLDYLAGAIYNSQRFFNVSPLTKEQLLQGRQELRTALNIAPTATSQQVVDSLVAVGNALAVGDQTSAMKFLENPIYLAGPQRTAAILSNMPYLHIANVATMKLGNEMYNEGGTERF